MPIYSNMPEDFYPRPSDVNAPLRSGIGIGPRGPKGHSITAEVIDTDPYGYFRVQFKDVETDEVLVTTPNLDVGSRFFVCNKLFEDVEVGSQQTANNTDFSTLQVSSDRSAIRVGDLVFFTTRTSDEVFVSVDTIGIGVVNSINSGVVSFITTNVMTAEISDGGIKTNMIADLAVTTAKIDNEAITNQKMAANSVDKDQIVLSAVTRDKIDNGAVNTSKLDDEAVTSAKLGNNAVTNTKIHQRSISSDKIDLGAVKTENIDDNAVTTNKIDDYSVTDIKLSSGSVTPEKFNTNVVDFLNELTEVEVRKWMDEHPEKIIPSDEQAEEVITEWLDEHPEATTTVLDNSITDAKLSSTGLKQVFYAGLASNYTITDGYRINSLSGYLIAEATYSYAEGVVASGMQITFTTYTSPNQYYGLAFYDKDNRFISGAYNHDTSSNTWTATLTVPQNATSYKLSCRTNSLDSLTVRFSNTFTEQVAKNATNIASLLPIYADYNTLDYNKISGYRITNIGTIYPESNYGYIEADVLPQMIVSGFISTAPDINHGGAFYNENDVVINTFYNDTGTNDWYLNLNVPNEAVKIRISFRLSAIDSVYINTSNIVTATKNAIINSSDNIFYCGPNRELTTLKAGIEEATKYMDATLYVDAGVYDLITEFGAEYFESLTSASTLSGLVLKNRVHVIFSPDSIVKSHYAGNNQYAQSLYSPFNAGPYGFTIENLTLEASRCRYCIHDERNGGIEQYSATYKRCTMHIDNSENDYWQNGADIGGGLGSNASVLVTDCMFSTNDPSNRGGVYYHQSNNSTNHDYASTVVIRDNYFLTGCVQIDDARSDATSPVKSVYKVSGNSFPQKYSGTNSEGVFVQNMTNPNSMALCWNNKIRS